jgi:2,3-bisphosphoglycerate-independent phosphoglycerate mutase
MDKVCLVVIDGWGLNENASEAPYDAIRQGDAPLMTLLCANLMNWQNKNKIQIESKIENKGDGQCNEAMSSSDNPSVLIDGMHVSALKLAAHGTAVGLPAGLMGNSEVGHLNIGAGRIVYQDIVRITTAIETNTLATQGSMPELIAAGKAHGRIHLIGLISDGGVHSHIDHLEALIDVLLQLCPNTTLCLHAILDGRDTPPTSAPLYLSRLLTFIHAKNHNITMQDQMQDHLIPAVSDLKSDPTDQSFDRVKLCSVMGRYWAMDRDERWERTAKAAACLHGQCDRIIPTSDIAAYLIDTCYARQETDEFVQPILSSQFECIKEEDVILFVNYRSDRMRQLVSCFIPPDVANTLYPSRMNLAASAEDQNNSTSTATSKDSTEYASYLNAPRGCTLFSMTQYHAGFRDVVSPLFGPQSMKNVLAEWLSEQNKTQCHIAETEKYAHVTFFFNGGQESAYRQEERLLVPSPRCATYDLSPAMSVYQVAEAVTQSLSQYDVIICNLAPPDMVGHTGNFEATKEAVHHTDEAIRIILKACQLQQIPLLITADHGNAEKMTDPITGAMHTAHTCNPVPFILAMPINSENETQTLCHDDIRQAHAIYYLSCAHEPALCDVAPTLLALLGLPLPPEMTGKSLLQKRH